MGGAVRGNVLRAAQHTTEAGGAVLTSRVKAGFAALLMFVLVLGGALVAVQLIPSSYAATSIVTVLPRPTSGVAADTVQLVAQKYVVLATANDTLSSAGAAIGTGAQELSHASAAVLAPGTGNIEVTVTLPDRQSAATAANVMAGELVRASFRDPLVVVQAVAPAVPASAESKPARPVLRTAGLLAALLAAALVWWLARGNADRAHPTPVSRRLS